jgi:hypothetical protein
VTGIGFLHSTVYPQTLNVSISQPLTKGDVLGQTKKKKNKND